MAHRFRADLRWPALTATVTLTVITAVAPSAAQAAPSRANAVVTWNLNAQNEIYEVAKQSPATAARSFAMVHAHATWIDGRTTVFDDGRVRGTAKMGANRPGPGAHIATASFMVAPGSRGRGVGTALCEDALAWARAAGFAGMQFNAVVETNTAAVRLYERLGFRVLGTVPRAFEHPTRGRVGLHLMYQEF
jgi:GNAT superfamily N-acetyltransferase